MHVEYSEASRVEGHGGSRRKSGHWSLRCLVALLLLVSILGVHFRGLWGSTIGTAVWGVSISADPIGVMSEAYESQWQKKRSCGDVVTLHSFPFGESIPPTFQRLLAPQWQFLRLGYGLSSNPVAVYNIAILLMFAVNFLAIYAAFRRWVRHWYVALVPATLMTFSAYTYAHSWAHLGLLLIFIFPLFFIHLCEFLEHGKKATALAIALTSAVGLYSSPYYLYFLFCIGLTILVTHAGLNPSQYTSRKKVGELLWLALLLLLVVTPFLCDAFLLDYSPYWAQGDFGRNYGQNLSMLNSFTARPRDYFLLNIHHFQYGDYLAQYITDQTPLRTKYSDELPVYLGIGPLFFVMICVVSEAISMMPLRLRTALERGLLGRLLAPWALVREKQRFLFMATMLVAVLAFFLSMPPKLSIFGYDWPMPNDFIRHLLPFRSYSRFGMVVLTGLAIGMGLAIDETRRPWLWTIAAIALCVFETTPKTYLHPASRERPFIRFLRERPEKTMMRLESLNLRLQRAIDLEAMLAEKFVLNGTINYVYGISDWLLQDKLPWSFNAGHLGDMGIQLLVVNGTLSLGARDKPYLEKLAHFPDENVQIWKIIPSGDERVAGLFKNLLGKREKDQCFVAPKPEVERMMGAYFEALKI